MDYNIVNIECLIQGQREYNKYDPRPDLKEDHGYWRLVLKEADKLDHNLYCILHGYRCVGARVKVDEGILKLKREKSGRNTGLMIKNTKSKVIKICYPIEI